MTDYASKKRLRQKVLDRWENEGGRLCEDLTKTPGSTLLREVKMQNHHPKFSNNSEPDVIDSSASDQRKRI